MLTEPLTIYGIRITGLAYSLKDGRIASRLTVTCHLDVPVAKALGCRDLLFLENETPKEGFARLDLDTACERYRALFECLDPELKQTFEIDGDACDAFCVDRLEGGAFRLRFRLPHMANLHGPLAFLEQIGTAQSWMKLTPARSAALFETIELGGEAEVVTQDDQPTLTTLSEITTEEQTGDDRSVAEVPPGDAQEAWDDYSARERGGSSQRHTRRSERKGGRRFIAIDAF